MTRGTLGGASEDWVRVSDLHKRADLIEEAGL
jgi:hypothetical protein